MDWKTDRIRAVMIALQKEEVESVRARISKSTLLTQEEKKTARDLCKYREQELYFEALNGNTA